LFQLIGGPCNTHLNWGASYWSRDIYDRLICQEWLQRQAGDTESVVVARLSGALILVLALVIMTHLDSIQQAWQISLTFGAGMGSVLVLRWLWERINLYSELAAIAVSIIAAPLLIATTDTEWIRLGTVALCSTTAAVAITVVTRDTKLEIRKAFYRQVRPMGLWRRTAESVDVDVDSPVERLGDGLKTTAIAAISVFAMLIGLGKLVVRPPEESILWALGFVVLSLALIPGWWRQAFGEHSDGADAEST